MAASLRLASAIRELVGWIALRDHLLGARTLDAAAVPERVGWIALVDHRERAAIVDTDAVTKALVVFERELVPEIRAPLARVAGSADVVEEALQRVREKLLLAEGTPRITGTWMLT